MNAIVSPFDFEGHPVRIIDEDGEPWFVAVDACKILGLAGDAGQHVRRLDDDERRKIPSTLLSNQGGPDVWVVSESGLYVLILRSDKPVAKPFRKWVTATVLPQIRKTGSFNTAPATVIDYSDPAVLLGVVQALQAKAQTALDRAITAEAQVEAVQPTLKAVERIEGSVGSLCLTDAAKTLKMGRDQLIRFLASKRWVYKRVGNKNWVAHATVITAGYMEHDEFRYKDSQGQERIATSARVTGKGLIKLARMLNVQLDPPAPQGEMDLAAPSRRGVLGLIGGAALAAIGAAQAPKAEAATLATITIDGRPVTFDPSRFRVGPDELAAVAYNDGGFGVVRVRQTDVPAYFGKRAAWIEAGSEWVGGWVLGTVVEAA